MIGNALRWGRVQVLCQFSFNWFWLYMLWLCSTESFIELLWSFIGFYQVFIRLVCQMLTYTAFVKWFYWRFFSVFSGHIFDVLGSSAKSNSNYKKIQLKWNIFFFSVQGNSNWPNITQKHKQNSINCNNRLYFHLQLRWPGQVYVFDIAKCRNAWHLRYLTRTVII